MLRVFGPRFTRDWSTTELAALVGKQVAISINGEETQGVVVDAGVGRQFPFIEFEDRRAVSWHRDTDEVYVSVTYPEES